MRIVYAAICALVLMVVVAACARNVQRNMEDGYQAGDVAEGLKADKAWYCGNGMMGIRKVARFVVAITTGTTIPDLCKVVDAVVEQ